MSEPDLDGRPHPERAWERRQERVPADHRAALPSAGVCRQPAMVGIARNAEPTVELGGTFVGPMACPLNEFSASDGHIVSYRFRHYKLGPLIGKRSWGRVVGIHGSLPPLDGGSLSVPEFSRFDLGGTEWVVENVGVRPDIVVDNDPTREFAGNDQQLNKAVEVLLAELKKNPPKPLTPPPYPKR